MSGLLVVSAGNPRRRVRKLARIAEVKVANVFHGKSWAVHDLQVNRTNPEWMDHARKTHAEGVAAMDALIEANFAWSLFARKPRAMHAGTVGKVSRRLPWSRHDDADSRKSLDNPDG